MTNLAAALALVLVWLPSPVQAQQSGEVAGKRADLEQLKERIRKLQVEVSRTENERSKVLKAVAAAEREVSRVQRKLRELEREHGQASARIAELEQTQAEIEQQLAARQAELREWLRRHYLFGQSASLVPLLAARDPNALGRDSFYLAVLGRERLGLLDELRTELGRAQQVKLELDRRREQLAGLTGKQEAERGKLEISLRERKLALEKLTSTLRSQRQEVSVLQQDERRLGQLIETLMQRARAAAAREAAERAAQQRAARDRAADSSRAAIAPPPSRSAEPVVGQVRASPQATPQGVRFQQLRGQLRFPVRGELVGRFGAPRADGGTSWKGVFIRAGSGTEVKAVAAGQVVFSDWLRGYGNMIIVDHGGDYLSIYGNNDSLLKEVGDRVGGGDTIASVGRSGGGEDSGLYFELRHQGRPLDPMQWVRLN